MILGLAIIYFGGIKGVKLSTVLGDIKKLGGKHVA